MVIAHRIAGDLAFPVAPSVAANLLRIDLKIQIPEVKPPQICYLQRPLA